MENNLRQCSREWTICRASPSPEVSRRPLTPRSHWNFTRGRRLLGLFRPPPFHFRVKSILAPCDVRAQIRTTPSINAYLIFSSRSKSILLDCCGSPKCRNLNLDLDAWTLPAHDWLFPRPQSISFRRKGEVSCQLAKTTTQCCGGLIKSQYTQLFQANSYRLLLPYLLTIL